MNDHKKDAIKNSNGLKTERSKKEPLNKQF